MSALLDGLVPASGKNLLNTSYIRAQVQKQQRSNAQSASSELPSQGTQKMTGPPVNKTALHPGGIQYVTTPHSQSHHRTSFTGIPFIQSHAASRRRTRKARDSLFPTSC